MQNTLFILIRLISQIGHAATNEFYFSYDGPNCISQVLARAGFISGHRYSPEEELNLYLNSHLCELLSPRQSLKKGDIGVLYSESLPQTDPFAPGTFGGNDFLHSRQQKFIHTFTYLGGNSVESKNGFTMESPLEETPIDKVIAEYAHVCSVGECQRITRNYRCQPFANNMNELTLSEEHPLIDLSKMIDQFEKRMGQAIIDKTSIDFQAAKNALQEIDELAQQISKTNVAREKRKYYRLFIRSLARRVRSLTLKGYDDTKGVLGDKRDPKLLWGLEQEEELFALGQKIADQISSL